MYLCSAILLTTRATFRRKRLDDRRRRNLDLRMPPRRRKDRLRKNRAIPFIAEKNDW